MSTFWVVLGKTIMDKGQLVSVDCLDPFRCLLNLSAPSSHIVCSYFYVNIMFLEFFYENRIVHTCTTDDGGDPRYGPFLLKLPYYHQKMYRYLTYFVFTNSIFFYMIMDRCIYLNQDHFVTKLNNGF